jgi:hypothetical protein
VCVAFRVITSVVLLGALWAAAAGCGDGRTPVAPAAAPTTTQAKGPSPLLKPEEVVRVVTEAMGRNDTPTADAGIATAFAFASPGNKQATGPLARFIPMVKSPAYRPLLNYAKIEYGPVRVEGDYAEQLVTVTDAAGDLAAFLFTLSCQADGDYEDCWMTDGVSRVGLEPIPPDPKERRQRDLADEFSV